LLVLSRRVGEVLYIGDDVKITVLSISGQQARVGISAPDDVLILREEVKLRNEREENER